MVPPSARSTGGSRSARRHRLLLPACIRGPAGVRASSTTWPFGSGLPRPCRSAREPRRDRGAPGAPRAPRGIRRHGRGTCSPSASAAAQTGCAPFAGGAGRRPSRPAAAGWRRPAGAGPRSLEAAPGRGPRPGKQSPGGAAELSAMEKRAGQDQFAPSTPRPQWTVGVDDLASAAEFLLFAEAPARSYEPLRADHLGKLYHIMLSLKSVMHPDVAGLTLVFDGLDAGVGPRGRGGGAARRWRRNSRCSRSAFSAVAAFADSTLAVRKRVEHGATVTFVEPSPSDAPDRGGRPHAERRSPPPPRHRSRNCLSRTFVEFGLSSRNEGRLDLDALSLPAHILRPEHSAPQIEHQRLARGGQGCSITGLTAADSARTAASCFLSACAVRRRRRRSSATRQRLRHPEAGEARPARRRRGLRGPARGDAARARGRGRPHRHRQPPPRPGAPRRGRGDREARRSTWTEARRLCHPGEIAAHKNPRCAPTSR